MKTNKLLQDGKRVGVYQCHQNDEIVNAAGERYSVYNTMPDFSGKYYLEIPSMGYEYVIPSDAKTLEEAKEELQEIISDTDGEVFNDFFKERYGKGITMTVTAADEKTISGLMYGDDECFNVNEFYQVLVSDGKVYECYYQLPNDDDDGDLSNIDYEHPYRVDDCTSKYEDAI